MSVCAEQETGVRVVRATGPNGSGFDQREGRYPCAQAGHFRRNVKSTREKRLAKRCWHGETRTKVLCERSYPVANKEVFTCRLSWERSSG